MRRYFAEFLGTFVLVLGGLGAAVLAGSQIGNVGIALAFGLSLLAMVYAIGPISGCHLNPAVTLGLYLCRKFERRDLLGYMVAQVLGAILAAGLILLIAKGAPAGYLASVGGLGANGYGVHSPGLYNAVAAFLVEMLMTAILVFTILGVTDIKAPAGFAGLAIGLALTLTNLVAIPITNASINPARSIGPAVFVGGWAIAQLWLFILAPIVGAMLAAWAYRGIVASRPPLAPQEAEKALPHEQAERKKERIKIEIHPRS